MSQSRNFGVRRSVATAGAFVAAVLALADYPARVALWAKWLGVSGLTIVKAVLLLFAVVTLFLVFASWLGARRTSDLPAANLPEPQPAPVRKRVGIQQSGGLSSYSGSVIRNQDTAIEQHGGEMIHRDTTIE